MATKNTKIKLWEGYEVEFDEQLADDFDYMQDLGTALKNNDLAELTRLYFALVGGEKTYNDMRDHIIEEEGRFSFKSVQKVMKRIDDALPKVGNRAQRRSWQTSR